MICVQWEINLKVVYTLYLVINDVIEQIDNVTGTLDNINTTQFTDITKTLDSSMV